MLFGVIVFGVGLVFCRVILKIENVKGVMIIEWKFVV